MMRRGGSRPQDESKHGNASTIGQVMISRVNTQNCNTGRPKQVVLTGKEIRMDSCAGSEAVPFRERTASTPVARAVPGGSFDERDDRPIEPTGTHHPFYSLAPLAEAVKWASRDGSYFNELIEANGGASVFKGHPGLAVTFLTDHASCEWFLSQPQSVLDRQDGATFGSLRCKKDYIGESVPTLVSNQNESHSAFREHAIKALKSRVPFAQSAMTSAADAFYKNLRENGMGEYTKVYDFFYQLLTHFTHAWIFGLGEEGGPPLPPFKDFLAVHSLNVSTSIEISCDTPVANLAATIGQLPRKATPQQLASMETILDAIRSSEVWASFLGMLKDSNVKTTDLERSFMFTSNFQSAVPISMIMMSVVANLTNNPTFLEELRNEVDGKDLTFESVRDTDNFPLLDSFHWEIQRMYLLPPFTVKEAKSDLVVPTSSGNRYQVRKGDMLCCEQALAQMDPSVFGPDAREFNPKRFVDNPELKKKVFMYGYIDHGKVEGQQFGCAAHAVGVLDSIHKIIYGKWVQEAEWELIGPLVISVDAFVGEVGPKGMAFAKVTPRQK